MTADPGTPGSAGDPDETETYLDGAPAESSRTFGDYRLLQRLGEGGMGEVWLAQQSQPLQRQVAIKVVKAGMDSARVVARFNAERQALAVMDHPAIAKVFDAGTTPEGRPFFAMEYVRGESITSYCNKHRLTIQERLELFIQLCDGVQHAHQKGIIHRDLKPSNVLVTITDDRPVPRIIDFGIAKAVAQPLTEHSLFTELGMFVGTPEYMSPEQAEMTPLDVDTRSDVYSLGLVLYELLTGMLPFDRDALRKSGLDAMRRTIREAEAPRPSTRITKATSGSGDVATQRRTQPARLASLLRGDLDWITIKALEKDRTRRYATANALAVDIRRHLADEPVSAGPPGAAYRAAKFVRRHRASVSAAISLVVVLAAVAGLMAVQARRIAQERDRANQEAATARQVSDFLVGLFKVSDPSQARGNTLTAREILDRGARQLEGGLRDQPRVQARLQATIGTVFTGLGLYSEAQPLLDRAFQTQKRVVGEDTIETVATEHALADVYWYLEKYREAEPLYRDVIQRRTRLLGENHQDTMKANFDLAGLYALEKRWDEFERLARDTLARQRRVLGDAHQDTVSSLNNLQYFYFQRGRYADAEPLALEVLEARRRAVGHDHPDTLRAMHNVATIYAASNRHDEAEATFLKTIEDKRRVLGDEHPDTCITLRRLAALYLTQKRYTAAEPLALAAYNGYAKRLGEHHAETRRSIEQLVTLYTATGQPAKADLWRAKLKSK
jgi:non-specific serine/threonine protein kinase/serine/threonine-protein kinase